MNETIVRALGGSSASMSLDETDGVPAFRVVIII